MGCRDRGRDVRRSKGRDGDGDRDRGRDRGGDGDRGSLANKLNDAAIPGFNVAAVEPSAGDSPSPTRNAAMRGSLRGGGLRIRSDQSRGAEGGGQWVQEHR